MDLARWSRRLEWSLAAAVVVLHLAIFYWPEHVSLPARVRIGPDYLLSTAHDAQLYSSIVLILAWTVLGPGWIWLRAAALPLLLVAWSLPWNTRMFPRETTASFPIAVGVAATVLVVVLRCCGQRTQRMAPGAGRERGAQFSLLALLISTTLIASVIGLLEGLRPIISGNVDQLSSLGRYVLDTVEDVLRPTTIRTFVEGTAVACAAIGGLWVVLRPGGIWLRLAALAIAVAGFGVYQAHLSGVGQERFAEMAINLGIGLASIALLAGVSALPLRLMDFRLQRLAKAKPAASRSDQAAVAPIVDSKRARERARLVARIAALASLLILIGGGIPLARHFHKPHSQTLQPPSQAFARWVNPRRDLILLRGVRWSVDLIDIETTYIPVIVDVKDMPKVNYQMPEVKTQP